MKNSHTSRNLRRLTIFFAACCALAALPLLSSAGSSPATSVNVVNNSSREIRNVYLSSVEVDDWSSNQLGNSVISPGQSFTLNNVACNGEQVKVIGEDADGCFVSTIVTCGDSVTWTVTNDTARDCGGN